MSNDELKKRILARRAKFVAAALAASGLGVAAACGGDVSQGGDAGTDAAVDSPPQPCLSPPQGDASADVAAEADTDADAAPQPCLVPIEDSGGGG
jgi:hypothetical protein